MNYINIYDNKKIDDNPHENYYYYNYSKYPNDNDADFFYINMMCGFLLFFFLFLSCYKSTRNYRISHERNQRLITSSSSSENNRNIEKIEIKFTNELYDKECTICLEDFNENELLYELTCKHYYHKECIDDWLSKKNTCPLCRLNLL